MNMRLICFLMTVALAGLFGGTAFAQQNNCNADLQALFQDREKTGIAVKTAGDRKATQPEMCQLLRRYTAAEEKLTKYLEENQAWCQVPPQAVGQLKANLEHARKIRTQVCSNTQPQAPAGPPPGAGIGALNGPSALGATPNRPANPSTQGSGVFSTLGGQ